jgi:hypothetical protein
MGKIEVRVCHRKLIEQAPTPYHKPDTNKEGFISEKAIKGQGMSHSYRYVDKIHAWSGALTGYPPAWTKRLTKSNRLSGSQSLSWEFKTQQRCLFFTTDQRVRLDLADAGLRLTYRF